MAINLKSFRKLKKLLARISIPAFPCPIEMENGNANSCDWENNSKEEQVEQNKTKLKCGKLKTENRTKGAEMLRSFCLDVDRRHMQIFYQNAAKLANGPEKRVGGANTG